MKYIVQLRRGTLDFWMSEDPVIADGELVLVSTNNKDYYSFTVAGDGKHRFSEIYKKQVSDIGIYNVDANHPRTEGYYTSETARKVIPGYVRKSALVISYMTDATTCVIEQFCNKETANWFDDDAWKQFAQEKKNTLDSLQVSNPRLKDGEVVLVADDRGLYIARIIGDGKNDFKYLFASWLASKLLFNADTYAPLTNGGYYTSESARKLVPMHLRRSGLFLSYRTAENVVVNEVFLSEDTEASSWQNDLNWNRFAQEKKNSISYWMEKNPVLADGEIAFVEDDSNGYYFATVVGDGKHHFAELLHRGRGLQSLINVDELLPLPDGIYYHRKSARVSIPRDLRMLGLIITYRTKENQTIIEQFIGKDITEWAVDTNWCTIKGECPCWEIIEQLKARVSELENRVESLENNGATVPTLHMTYNGNSSFDTNRANRAVSAVASGKLNFTISNPQGIKLGNIDIYADGELIGETDSSNSSFEFETESMIGLHNITAQLHYVSPKTSQDAVIAARETVTYSVIQVIWPNAIHITSAGAKISSLSLNEGQTSKVGVTFDWEEAVDADFIKQQATLQWSAIGDASVTGNGLTANISASGQGTVSVSVAENGLKASISVVGVASKKILVGFVSNTNQSSFLQTFADDEAFANIAFSDLPSTKKFDQADNVHVLLVPDTITLKSVTVDTGIVSYLYGDSQGNNNYSDWDNGSIERNVTYNGETYKAFYYYAPTKFLPINNITVAY